MNRPDPTFPGLSTGLLCLIIAVFCLSGIARADSPLWEKLAGGGHFAMMRHAIAPGTGDPADFRIGDCTTQRNLDARGREQAGIIGKAFSDAGITRARVFTSQWCRCRETATLLGLGEPEDLPALNSFFRDRQSGDSQTVEILNWMKRQDRETPIILVTHQVNITALTGVYPASGEIVVFRLGDAGKVEVAGRIRPD